jgi:hypothetical protein
MSDDNHHWVPKFLIKAFAHVDGRVFCFNIQTDEVTKPPPKFAASDVGFNNFHVNGQTVSYEDHLEKIETAAARILKTIVASASAAGLTDLQREQVANFVAAQSFRTEAFYKGLGSTAARKDFGPIFAELWRGAAMLSAEIKRRKWVPMVIEHDDVFYLGDHPVVLQHTETLAVPKPLGFDIEGVEAFMPLSPRCALYMPCASVSRLIIDSYGDALAAQENLSRANEAGVKTGITGTDFLALAERVRKNSGPLYESLTQGTAVVASRKNVENLNYLQCAWAHTAIYANRPDFTFARHVFKNSPQYRGLVKVSLGSAEASSE